MPHKKHKTSTHVGRGFLSTYTTLQESVSAPGISAVQCTYLKSVIGNGNKLQII